MRKGAIAIPLIVAVLPTFSGTAWAVRYDDITALELKHRMLDKSDNRFVILDMRDEAAYKKAHIPGAVNIPLKELGYKLFR